MTKHFRLALIAFVNLISLTTYAQVEFGGPYVIANPFLPRTPSSIIAVDVDKDFDIDIVVNNYRYPNGPLIWYENTRQESNMFIPHLIEDTRTLPGLSVDVADLDNDGDRDILATYESDVVLAWYENFPAVERFSPAQAISTEAVHPYAVKAIDMDRDLDQDVLVISIHGELQWFENTDSKGTFGELQNLNEDNPVFAESICLADLDGDSDKDLIAFTQTKTVWYELRNDTAAFSGQKMISDSLSGIFTGAAADLDNDEDVDVVAAGYNYIVVSKNIDARGNFDSTFVITQSAGDIRSLAVADLDNDGFADIMTATISGEIKWYRNTDYGRKFASAKVIYKSNAQAGYVASADFNLDGNNDVVSAFTADVNGLLFHKNLWTPTDVESDTPIPESFKLFQNYPNPFNPITTIEYRVSTGLVISNERSDVRNLKDFSSSGNKLTPRNDMVSVKLAVYDILGREVSTLVNEQQKPGQYRVQFDGAGLASGVYYCALRCGTVVFTRKMILLK